MDAYCTQSKTGDWEGLGIRLPEMYKLDLSFNLPGGTPRGHLLPCSLRGPVNHVCFSPDAQYLAVCAAQETLVFHTEVCA